MIQQEEFDNLLNDYVKLKDDFDDALAKNTRLAKMLLRLVTATISANTAANTDASEAANGGEEDGR